MTLFEQLQALTTEGIDPAFADLDLLNTRQLVSLINEADKSVALAVESQLDHIAQAVDLAVEVVGKGGRIIYIGAGTSGRLGILDASEMPPTFGTDPELVSGIIAGGSQAVFRSVEGAEDSSKNGEDAFFREIEKSRSRKVENEGSRLFEDSTSQLLAIGLSASGRTPFVLGALHAAHRSLHKTVLISTNPREVVQKNAPFVDVLICPVVGPEVVAGSTRMKSGTAQKMVLNMITTATMVRLGKTYGNVMVDLQLTNEKLKERAKRIVMTICEVTYESAESLLKQSNNHVKTAIVMGLFNCTKADAEEKLAQANGKIRQING